MKNEYSILNDKLLDKMLNNFVEEFKQNEKDSSERVVNIEEVKSLVNEFKGKTALTVLFTIVLVGLALPINEFLTFCKIIRTGSKAMILQLLMSRMKFKY